MDSLHFKFHWVNEKGEKEGFLAKKGFLAQETLTLDDTEIPVGAIASADVRGEFLILTLPMESGELSNFVIATSKAKQLKIELGRLRSAIWAEQRKQELAAEGRGHHVRHATCPACEATLDLTNFADTPQVSCDFCHNISTLRTADGTPLTEVERGYRICDECGMFSHPKQFTIFYFYFLLVVYGWTSRITWRCPGCMRSEAWKMLFGNLIFVLGVPSALMQLYRCYIGANRGAIYPGLDAANLRARQGNLPQAIDSYQEILTRRPTSVGVKHNLGLAFLEQEQIDKAAKMFEFALADCSNYQPSAGLLAACYDKLGEDEKLEELKEIWEVQDPPEELEEARSADEIEQAEEHL